MLVLWSLHANFVPMADTTTTSSKRASSRATWTHWYWSSNRKFSPRRSLNLHILLLLATPSEILGMRTWYILLLVFPWPSSLFSCIYRSKGSTQTRVKGWCVARTSQCAGTDRYSTVTLTSRYHSYQDETPPSVLWTNFEWLRKLTTLLSATHERCGAYDLIHMHIKIYVYTRRCNPI